MNSMSTLILTIEADINIRSRHVAAGPVLLTVAACHVRTLVDDAASVGGCYHSV